MLEDSNYREHIPKSVKIRTLFKSSACALRLEKEHFTEPERVVCKFCGSTAIMKCSIRKDVETYICKKACGRVFIAKVTPYQEPIIAVKNN